MTWPAAAVYHSLRSLAWKGVKSWVRRSFSSVPMISTAELADLLQQESAEPLLIDARSLEEYQVSHLLHAHRAKTLTEAETLIQQAGIIEQTAEQTPIVVYCSIGYRSGRLGKALQDAGYRVRNLEGSIFQWANEGRSLITANLSANPSANSSASHSTQQVHPYSRLWGLLLDPTVPKLN